jgi:hypothetical protein
MAVYDSLGNYILFETGSRQPTRTWNRSESSGRDTTGPRVLEKLKYTVLKNPPNTFRKSAINLNHLSTQFTVVVNGRTYAIDAAIFAELSASLLLNPVYSLSELKSRIAEVRVLTQTLAPLSVQLENVPLSQYLKRYAYLSTDSPPAKTNEQEQFDFSYRVGDLISTPYLDLILQYYKNLYPTAYFATAQYLNVCPNTGRSSRPIKVRDLYPGGDADRFGTTLLSVANLSAHRIQVEIPYVAMLAYFSPASNRANGGKFTSKTGLILGFDYRFPLVASTIAAGENAIAHAREKVKKAQRLLNNAIGPAATQLAQQFLLAAEQVLLSVIAAAAVDLQTELVSISNLMAFLELNGELIFVPIQTRLEQVSYVDYPPGTNLDLRATNGGENDNSTFNLKVQQFNVGMANSKSIARTTPAFIF